MQMINTYPQVPNGTINNSFSFRRIAIPLPPQTQDAFSGLSNSAQARQAMKLDRGIVATLIGAIATALLAMIVAEAQGLKTEVSELTRTVNNNHVELIGKIDSIDKQFSVAIGHLQDLKANVRR